MKDTTHRPRPSRRDSQMHRPRTAERRGADHEERDIPKLSRHDERMHGRD